MKVFATYITLVFILFIQGCGTLDSKTILISTGDNKEKVIEVMGVPDDRQMQQQREAWQYCVSGAGFGYNDHKIIWFNSGLVTGITSYKTTRTGCTGGIRAVRWESAPDYVLETRAR